MLSGLLKVVLSTALVAVYGLPSVQAGDKYEHESYQEKLVKSRAKRGYTNHGTVIYNYQEVDKYSDDLDPETLGVIEPEAGVREIHNYVIIHSDVDSEKDDLEIGTVTGGSGRDIKVNNAVTIDGDVRSKGREINLGTVRTRDAPGEVTNDVEIRGDVDN